MGLRARLAMDTPRCASDQAVPPALMDWRCKYSRRPRQAPPILNGRHRREQVNSTTEAAQFRVMRCRYDAMSVT